ncbi:hypothetical protein ABIB68_007647 [Bradyrhizobium sp. F1.2.2]
MFSAKAAALLLGVAMVRYGPRADNWAYASMHFDLPRVLELCARVECKRHREIHLFGALNAYLAPFSP